MALMTSWQEVGIAQGMAQGMAQGITEGKEALVMRQIRRRLGAVPAQAAARLPLLSAEQLDELGEALLDFETAADLESWLAGQE